MGNLVGSPDSGFESDTNTVTLFFRDGTSESLPTMDKAEVAHILLDRILTRASSAAAPKLAITVCSGLKVSNNKYDRCAKIHPAGFSGKRAPRIRLQPCRH